MTCEPTSQNHCAELLVRIAIVLAAGLSVAPALAQDKAKIAAGEAVYNDYCQNCHGSDLANVGGAYDLRRLRKDERARFEQSVLNGKNQMPPWRGVLNTEQIDQLWAFIRTHANDR